VRLRDDAANPARGINRSILGRDGADMRAGPVGRTRSGPPLDWLKAPDGAQAWTDDRSSILPYVRWDNIFRM